MMARPVQCFGFTLAEVLIALALLGVVAAFSIPKVLQVVQVEQNNSRTREVMGILSQAYQQYKLQNNYGDSPPTTTIGEDLFKYINHNGIVTSGTINNAQGSPLYDCANPDYACVRLHNGGILGGVTHARENDFSFGGTGKLNAINFVFDPDGVALNGTGDHASTGIGLYLYYAGDMRTGGRVKPNTVRANGQLLSPGSPVVMVDPSWLKF